MSEILQVFILSLVEGLTEFIPVSSTGHMVLVGHLIEFTGKKAATFEIFIQLGAILAVALIYKGKLLLLLPGKKLKKQGVKEWFSGGPAPTLMHIALAIVPVLLAGFLAHGYIKEYLFSAKTVAIGLVVGGIIMIIVELSKKSFQVMEVEKLGFKQALIIGLGQCFALWPGVSRSGSTMVTSMLVGVSHKPAADFSFIIAIPVMVAAVSYDMLKSWHLLEQSDIIPFASGFILSFIFAWLSVKWFLGILPKVKLIPFGIYRILIGGVTWFLIG
jgi:undecaprenyl-diphosphatase